VGTFNFSAKYLDKTTEQVTIIQLVTILLIYKVLQHQDESFSVTGIVIHLQFNINDRHSSFILKAWPKTSKDGKVIDFYITLKYRGPDWVL
jgi:hypothetical protein